MATREQNERKFKHWEELPNGGRRYIREFAGRAGGRARYVKEVDAAERTSSSRPNEMTLRDPGNQRSTINYLRFLLHPTAREGSSHQLTVQRSLQCTRLLHGE